MAITFIYPIKVTGEKSLDYDKEDKEYKVIRKEDSKDSLNYIMRDKRGNTQNLTAEYLNKMKDYVSIDNEGNVIFKTISTGLNCVPETAYSEWEIVRNAISKTGKRTRNNTGNLQYCIVQNFGTDLDPLLANEIGMEFAKKYLSDYQCVVSTHINTGYVHNHIEFNATSFINGKKFNDNLKAIADIRKISDELCEKYELSVLEKTRNFNYTMYRDNNGKVHFYEHTERKDNHLPGEVSNKNSYINTKQYEEYKKNNPYAHREIIKHDIDVQIAFAKNYEDLLKLLRNIGYSIKDKTKNGEWRKHITFKYMDWEKGVRDSQIGDDYTRIALTNKIQELQNEKSKLDDYVNEPTPIEEDEIFKPEGFFEKDEYEYGKYDFDSASRDFHYKRVDNKYKKEERSEIEKLVYDNAKKINSELDNIIKNAFRYNTQQFNTSNKKKRLIDNINRNLESLSFIEERNLISVNQMTANRMSLIEKQKECAMQLMQTKEVLEVANNSALLIEKYNQLKNSIEENCSNPDYLLFEYENEKSLFEKIEKELKSKNLYTKEEQQKFQEDIKDYNERFADLVDIANTITNEIKQYDNCINVIREINIDDDYENNIENKLEDYHTSIDDDFER